jgi:hypothetical protein
LEVGNGLSSDEGQLGEVEDVGGALNDHQQEELVVGLLVLEEPMDLRVGVQLVCEELIRLWNDILHLVGVLVRAKTNDLDLSVVSQEEVLVAETDVLD